MGKEKRRVCKKRSSSIDCAETYRKGKNARRFDPTKRGQTDAKEQGSEYKSDVVDALLWRLTTFEKFTKKPVYRGAEERTKLTK